MSFLNKNYDEIYVQEPTTSAVLPETFLVNSASRRSQSPSTTNCENFTSQAVVFKPSVPSLQIKIGIY